MCTLAQPQHSPTSSDTSVSVFASLLSPHNDASLSACPVTAHITPDVEKVSSYFPPSHSSLPVQYSPPKHLPHSRFAPALNLPRHHHRESDPLIVFVLPQPLAHHRVHPPGTSIPIPSVIVILLCRLPHAPPFSFTFVVKSSFDLCTYALLSLPILLSRLSRFTSLLPCGCNVTTVSSHHPTIHLYSVITSFFPHCIRLSFSYLATTISIGMG